MSEITDFEELLTETIKKDALQIWIPTNGAYSPFKHLTFDQHTRFLGLESDDTLDPIERTFKFVELLNQIILECYLGTENMGQITIIDRNAIALQLRVALDDRFQVTLDETVVDISLKDHVSMITTIGSNKFIRNSTVSHGSLSLTLDIPSITKDQAVNTEILEFDSESDEFPQFLLSAELVKFIKTVTISQNGQTNTLNLFEPGKIAESIHICRKLPLPLVNLVGEYVQKVQTIESQLMTLQVPVVKPDSSESQTVEVPILINTNWFTSV